MLISRLAIVLWLMCLAIASAGPNDGNRLTYLDGSDPYYPHRDFPKLMSKNDPRVNLAYRQTSRP